MEGIVEEVTGGQKTVQGYEAMMMAVASSSYAEKVVIVGLLIGIHGSECKIGRFGRMCSYRCGRRRELLTLPESLI